MVLDNIFFEHNEMVHLSTVWEGGRPSGLRRGLVPGGEDGALGGVEGAAPLLPVGHQRRFPLRLAAAPPPNKGEGVNHWGGDGRSSGREATEPTDGT